MHTLDIHINDTQRDTSAALHFSPQMTQIISPL